MSFGVAGTHGGKFGLINGVPNMRMWSITDAQTIVKSVTSATAFGTAARQGVEEWSGQFENCSLVPTVMPGDSFVFSGYEAPDNDAFGVGEQYAGQAMCKQLAIDWNWQAAEIIKNTYDFDGDLQLVITAAQNPPLDAATPYSPSVILAKWEYSLDGGSTWVTWTNMVSGNLTFVNAVQEYVNSSCVVTSLDTKKHIWKGRRSGPWDMTATVVEEAVDRARFQKGDEVALRCWIDGTNKWVLKYFIVRDFTGITVNRQTGAIVQQTVGLDFNASEFRTGSGVLGLVTKPDNTTWWPLAQS